MFRVNKFDIFYVNPMKSDAEQLANFLEVSLSTVYRWVTEGVITAYEEDGVMYFYDDQVILQLALREVEKDIETGRRPKNA